MKPFELWFQPIFQKAYIRESQQVQFILLSCRFLWLGQNLPMNIPKYRERLLGCSPTHRWLPLFAHAFPMKYWLIHKGRDRQATRATWSGLPISHWTMLCHLDLDHFHAPSTASFPTHGPSAATMAPNQRIGVKPQECFLSLQLGWGS